MSTIRIDEELCDGCGLCVTACVEGALALVGGKAKLVKPDHCDGLGVCVGECPRGAITVVETAAGRPAEKPMERMNHHGAGEGHACPGSKMIDRRPTGGMARGSVGLNGSDGALEESELSQWPVQLHLVPPRAPYFRDADLVLAADCTAFARADFHARFLHGRSAAIACPKLDDPDGYVEKLTAMMEEGGIRSLTIVIMEVPCCGGLERIARIALENAGRRIPVRRVVIGIDGGILDDRSDDSCTG